MADDLRIEYPDSANVAERDNGEIELGVKKGDQGAVIVFSADMAKEVFNWPSEPKLFSRNY